MLKSNNTESVDLVETVNPTEAPTSMLLTPEEVTALAKEAKAQQDVASSPGTAFGAAALRGLSAGLSDVALTKSGIVSPEKLKALKEENKVASALGEVTGTVGGALLPVGPIATIGKVGAAASKLAAKGLEKALQTSSGGIVKSILAKGAETAVGSVVEGALYGTGQLISEEALGNAEYNAQNVIASMGLGALFGGSIGAGLGTISSSLKAVGGKLNLSNTPKTLPADVKEQAIELIGVNGAKKVEFMKRHKDVANALPEILKKDAEMGLFTKDKTILDYFKKVDETSGKEIDAIFKDFKSIDYKIPAREFYAQFITNIDSVLGKYKKTGLEAEMSSQLGGVKKLRDTYMSKFNKSETDIRPLTINDINNTRHELNDIIFKIYDKDPAKFTLKERIALKNAKYMRGVVDDMAENISRMYPDKSSLAAKLKQANFKNHASKTVVPFLEKKIAMSKPFKWEDAVSALVLGGLAYEVTGDVFAGATGVGVGGAASKLISSRLAVAHSVENTMASDLVRKASILRKVEKANQAVEGKIKKTIKGLLSGARTATPLASTAILFNTDLAKKDYTKKPKSKEEAVQNVMNNLASLKDTAVLDEKLNINTAALDGVAPLTRSAIHAASGNALNFLQGKLPKQRTIDPLMLEEMKIDKGTIARFENYIQAIERPLEVLDDIQHGRVSPEALEALKAVYPSIYEKVQLELGNELAKKPKLSAASKRVVTNLYQNKLPTGAVGVIQKSFVKAKAESEGRKSNDKIKLTTGMTESQRIEGRE